MPGHAFANPICAIRLEMKLVGRKFFNELPGAPDLAIRELDELRRAPVLSTARLGWTRSGCHGLAHIRKEVLAGGAIALQSIGRDHLQAPRLGLAVGPLHIQVNVGVRILPIDVRKSAFQIHALACVELDTESMVRKGGSRRAE